jgi:lipopolysaccharide export system ATP-binding protein
VTEALLQGRGLSQRYGGVDVLRGVNIGVSAGQIVGLIGPNGAGKSTAFRLLAGTEVPVAGSVWLRNKDITSWPLHRRARAGIAYLPQHPSVLPRLTVAENLAIAVEANPGGSSVAEYLADAGLQDLHDRIAGRLSGGERRRLEIARARAIRPAILLLDEPFSGVDPGHVSDLQARIRAMADEGTGVLLTDHAVRAALSICDHVYLLDAGIVVVSGPSSEVASDTVARERYLGHDFCLETRLHDGVVAYNEEQSRGGRG